MAGHPMDESAMLKSATLICSPALISISISRCEASCVISPALAMSSSVVSPWAETTTTTSLPPACVCATMRATFITRSRSATELPPNFCTINAIFFPPLSIGAA